MTEAQHCPRCGCARPNDAPQGLCPACLIAAVMEPSDVTGAYSRASKAADHADETTDPSGGRVDSPGCPTDAATPVTVRYFGVRAGWWSTLLPSLRMHQDASPSLHAFLMPASSLFEH